MSLITQPYRRPILHVEQLEVRATPASGLDPSLIQTCDCSEIKPVNLPPTANADSYESVGNGAQQLDVLGNDTDPDGDPLFIIGVTQPAQGNVSITDDAASVIYDPGTSFQGTDSFEYTVADGWGGQATTQVSLGHVSPPPSGPLEPFAVGAGPGGGGTVIVYNPDATVAYRVEAFTSSESPGGVRVGLADITNDGIADLIAGTGSGVATEVRIYDGATQDLIRTIEPFESTFTGGVFVAAGDVNGDQIADYVITPDQGGGPRARVFDGQTGDQIADYFGIEDPDFRGGARVAVGDLNGDDFDDLIFSAGFLGGPRVALWDGRTLGSSTGARKFVPDFFMFENTLRNGLFPVAINLNGDNRVDIGGGAGPGGGPRILILDSVDVLAGNVETAISNPLANFFAGDINNRGGVRVAAKNLDNDRFEDLITGAGTDAAPRVTTYMGTGISPDGTPPERDSLLTFDSEFLGGVFVG